MTPLLYNASITIGKTGVVIVYVVLLYRLLGKRFAAQMNVYDLAAIVAVANSVQNAMTQGKGDLYVGIASSATLILVGWSLSKALVRVPKIEGLVIGSPTLIVYEGHVFYDRMKRESLSTEELITAMHEHGLAKLQDIGMAVLEVDGSISVVPGGRGCKVSTNLS